MNPYEVDLRIFPANNGTSGIDHPCPKPLFLMRWLIAGSKTSGIIIDPFMGSATTLLAAKELGRQAVGIELCEAYCETAVNRLRQEMLPLAEVAPQPEQLEFT
jgi:site-specific DNA-methyltransferase (adenine-specific)